MGGAEKMALEIISILIRNGYKIHLHTVDKTNWDAVNRKLGKYTKPSSETYYTKGKLDPEYMYDWIKTGLIYLYIIIKTHVKYEICINNYAEVFPYFCELSFFHAEPLFQQEGNPYRVPFWGLIKPYYDRISQRLNEKICTGVFITNSSYNKEIISQRFKKKSLVIYPFVEPINYFYNVTKNGQVLIISRLTPGKNLLDIIPLSDALHKKRFILMGQTTPHTVALTSYLKDLKRLTIIRNPDRDQYKKIIRESSIVLSTQENEAFGISLLEAMSGGCVPLVPKSGGPWMDILEAKQGEFGLGYESIEDAIDKIDLLLSDVDLRYGLRKKSIQRSNEFTKSRFEEDLLDVVSMVCESPCEKSLVYYKFIELDQEYNKISKTVLEFKNTLNEKKYRYKKSIMVLINKIKLKMDNKLEKIIPFL